MTPENPTPIYIWIHCRKCDNRLEAYADTLQIALDNLDDMKEKLTAHMENDDCAMPPDHPAPFINPTPPPAKRRTPADVEIYRKEPSNG